MAMGTYWLPRGVKVVCNGIEITLDDDTNSVLVDEKDWPTLQRAFFPPEDWDDDVMFDETEASAQAAEAAATRGR